MPTVSNIDELLCLVSTWDRDQLVTQFQTASSRFPVDFTPEFYYQQTLDRLRHIYVALYLQNMRPRSFAA